MDFNKLTIKSQEAVQEALNLVRQNGQQQVETAHLLLGVLKVGDSIVNFLFQKLGVNSRLIEQLAEKQMTVIPKGKWWRTIHFARDRGCSQRCHRRGWQTGRRVRNARFYNHFTFQSEESGGFNPERRRSYREGTLRGCKRTEARPKG